MHSGDFVITTSTQFCQEQPIKSIDQTQHNSNELSVENTMMVDKPHHSPQNNRMEFILNPSIVRLIENNITEQDILEFKKGLQLTQQQRQEAEDSIQREETWFKYRQDRLTVSNAGAAAGHNPKMMPGHLLKELLFRTFQGNFATEYGTEMESTAFDIAEFNAIVQGNLLGIESDRIWIEEKGIYIDKVDDWLGASPDGILHIIDKDGNEELVYIEIKCPISKRFYNNNWPHYYYDQIQAGMAITGIHKCYAVILTPSDVAIMTYTFNENYWTQELYPKLKDFYWRLYVPLLILKKKNLLTKDNIEQMLGEEESIIDKIPPISINIDQNNIKEFINQTSAQDNINIDSIMSEARELIKAL